MYKLCIGALFTGFLFLSSPQYCYAYTGDMSGIHGYAEDDRSQLVDLWLNTSGNVTIKVSNGRQWRPMWVVVHAHFMSGNQVLTTKDYHVFCQSPLPGGPGKETWFNFKGPGVVGVSSISLGTNKEKPWYNRGDGWEVMISTPSLPAPARGL
jgi:hypothetical protein